MRDDGDYAPLLWCSLHRPARCTLAKRALALYKQADAGQAAVMLQSRQRGGNEYHMVVCTGGEQGLDQGWIEDVASYPWRNR